MTGGAFQGTADVFLTGATGFIGSHVLRALLDEGYSVRALARDSSSPRLPTGCAMVHGELRRPGELVRHLAGCRFLVHSAALYSFSPATRPDAWQINVAGTRGLLEAARIAGVERAVVTSSSATVGPARGSRAATEADYAFVDAGAHHGYHASKIAQEQVAIAARLPVVLILPTAPVGPGDWKPTPTGKMVVDFMRGRIFASIPGGLNVVAVDDVARAHVAALRHGRDRERYLVGGENLSLSDLWRRLAVLCGTRAPRRNLPYGLASALAWLDEWRCRAEGRISGRAVDPAVPVEGVAMARYNMFIDDSKARRELGHDPTSVDTALARAVSWYREHGYAF
ncbi:MAG TPA: NAD-dependent epimerase/dehydratase family protein [Chloroflexota bacterium]|nr:NAD-dependent epimerase/dehydratase family protein [Chloroflexota bacterium]